MRKKVAEAILALIITVVTLPAIAESNPEQIVQQYLNAMQMKNWNEVANYFDISELEKFKSEMLPLFELSDARQIQIRDYFFGPGLTLADVQAMPADEFLARVLGNLLGAVNTASAQIIGTVKEDENTYHIVTRNKAEAQGVTIEEMEVVSVLKSRQDNRWVIPMNKISGIGDKAKARMGVR